MGTECQMFTCHNEATMDFVNEHEVHTQMCSPCYDFWSERHEHPEMSLEDFTRSYPGELPYR